MLLFGLHWIPKGNPVRQVEHVFTSWVRPVPVTEPAVARHWREYTNWPQPVKISCIPASLIHQMNTEGRNIIPHPHLKWLTDAAILMLLIYTILLTCLQLKSTAWMWQDTASYVQLTIKMSSAKLSVLRTVRVFRTMSRSVIMCLYHLSIYIFFLFLFTLPYFVN